MIESVARKSLWRFWTVGDEFTVGLKRFLHGFWLEVDSVRADAGAALQKLGGAKVIMITASGGKTVAETFKGLRPEGVSIVLGVGREPIETSSADLIFGNRKLRGALTGDPATGDATLRFSLLSGASAMIETVPLGQAAAAYAKMMSGKARFRMVLTMER